MNDDMGQADWGSTAEASAKKSRFPKWSCCCLGCGVPVLIVAALAMMGVQKVSDGKDSELQWARLNEDLPIIERPPGLSMEFGFQLEWFDFDFYLMVRPPEGGSPEDADRAWILLGLPVDEGEFLKEAEPWEAPDSETALTTLQVQGRSLGVGWFDESDSAPVSIEPYWKGHSSNSSTIAVEIPGQGETPTFVLVVAGGDLEALTQAEVLAFLNSFELSLYD